jgi:hypothetical protein
VIHLQSADSYLGIPLTNNADCEEGAESKSAAGTVVKSVTTTVTATASVAPSSSPSDTSQSNVCRGSLKRHPSIVLWEGTPSRTDTAAGDFSKWRWLEEIASATNALLGLVEVAEESGTGTQKDILANRYVGTRQAASVKKGILRLKWSSVYW